MDLARLTYMANQIARNFAVQGEDAAIAATCEHLQLFWDPRMKAAIVASDRAGLEPIAAAACALLMQDEPAQQDSERGHGARS
jgi:formate dehydrogenase subunit delta